MVNITLKYIKLTKAIAMHKLKPEERERGVIAASAGNHALALAYHGQQLGVSFSYKKVNFALKIFRFQ